MSNYSVDGLVTSPAICSCWSSAGARRGGGLGDTTPNWILDNAGFRQFGGGAERVEEERGERVSVSVPSECLVLPTDRPAAARGCGDGHTETACSSFQTSQSCQTSLTRSITASRRRQNKKPPEECRLIFLAAAQPAQNARTAACLPDHSDCMSFTSVPPRSVQLAHLAHCSPATAGKSSAGD